MSHRLKSVDRLPVARVRHYLISQSGLMLSTTICLPPPKRFTPGSSSWEAEKPSKMVSPAGTRMWTILVASLPNDGSKAESIVDCNGPVGGMSVQYARNFLSALLYVR